MNRHYLVAALALGLAAAFVITQPRKASAQQYAVLGTCQTQLDGGTFEVCGSITTNYQPIDGVCSVSVPGASSAGTTINVLGSPDGVHFGTIADAGLGITAVVNGDGGPNAVNVAFSISPTNPYQSIEITASATAIDGGTGGPGALNCYVGVIQSQTLHLVKPKTKPKAMTIENQ